MPVQTLQPPLTVEEVDAYFADSFNGETWSLLTVEEKDIAMQQGMYWFETLQWVGDRCTPETCWPRENASCNGIVATCDEIPAVVASAYCELCLALQADQDSMITSQAVDSAAGAIRREKLDVLEQWYYSPRDSGAVVGGVQTTDPLLIQRYPWLKGMLGCWVTLNPRSIRLYRG